MSKHDEGSFLTGFSLGIFAGAMGFFLFGTNDGKKIRHDLNQEWEKAKVKLAEDGIIANPDQNLRDVIHDYVAKIWGEKKADEIIPPSLSEKHVKPKSKSKSSESKKTTKKFKGI